eukprot:TRINITY_DN4444_c0_g1_i1.p1 TRINITY_DN4444_c0_g1~~TRINITY_DN4444_c0_g1_i1.p1  ORF type:complete len:184 (+),score=35.70 TRINITY_DN4444_c0_g1_i1:157-708(+)
MESPNFTPAQMEFLAEDEKINIIPSFKMDVLHLISGDYGPFIPGIPKEVPLWLAITLKKRKMCKIQMPEWMDLDNLQHRYESEKQIENGFEDFPFHYQEIANLLLTHASDDIPNSMSVGTIISDIVGRRSAKVFSGLRQVSGVQAAVQFNNLAAIEITRLRPFFVKAMDQFHQLSKENEDPKT